MGEDLFITGSIPELGLWRNYKCAMKWTPGHIWETVEPI